MNIQDYQKNFKDKDQTLYDSSQMSIFSKSELSKQEPNQIELSPKLQKAKKWHQTIDQSDLKKDQYTAYHGFSNFKNGKE